MKNDNNKKKKRNNKFFNIIWMVYSILFGPIEMLCIYLFSYDKGIFKGLLYLLIICFCMLLIPLIIRLLFKIFRIEVFEYDYVDEMIPIIITSLVISWVVLCIIALRKEGIFSLVFSSLIILAVVGFVHSIPLGIAKLFYGAVADKLNPNKDKYSNYGYSSSYSSGSYDISYNTNKSNDVQSQNKKDDSYEKDFKITVKTKDLYNEFGTYIGKKEIIKTGDWHEEVNIYDTFGNKVGNSDKLSFGDYSNTRYYDKNGKEVAEKDTYKF